MSTNDMKSAEKTYSAFIDNLKWIVPVLCVITLLVILIIS